MRVARYSDACGKSAHAVAAGESVVNPRYIKQTFAALPTRVATLCGFFCNELVNQTDNDARQEDSFELCEKHPFGLLQSLPTQ